MNFPRKKSGYTLDELKEMLSHIKEVIPTMTLRDLKALYPLKKEEASVEETDSGESSGSQTGSGSPSSLSGEDESPSPQTPVPAPVIKKKSDEKPALREEPEIITVSSDSEVRKRSLRILDNYPKDYLAAVCQGFVGAILQGKVIVRTESGKPLSVESLLKGKVRKFDAGAPKMEIMKILSPVLDSLRNFRVFLSLAPLPYDPWELYMSLPLRKYIICNAANEDVVTGKRLRFPVMPSRFTLGLLASGTGRRIGDYWSKSRETIYDADYGLIRLLIEWRSPSVTAPRPSGCVPALEGLHTFVGDDIGAVIKRLVMMDRAGLLQVGTSGRLLISSRKKIMSVLECKTPPPSGFGPETGILEWRKELLATLCHTVIQWYGNLSASPREIICKSYSILESFIYENRLSFALPHLSKITKKDLRYDRIGGLMNGISDFIGKFDSGEWIDIRELLDALCYSSGESPFSMIPIETQWWNSSRTQGVYNDLLSRPVGYNETTEIVGAFVRGIVMIYSALGLLEVAGEYAPGYSSWFEGLRYLRPTDLCRYVMGKAKDVKIDEGEDSLRMILDSDALVVRDPTSAGLFVSYLTGIGIPLGGGRFIIDERSFCREIHSADALHEAIDKFRDLVDKGGRPGLPQIWNDFFESLLARTTAVSRGTPVQYTIYRLDPKRRELLEWISSDPVIRSYTLRAEGCYLLVDASKQYEFEEALARRGYLL